MDMISSDQTARYLVPGMTCDHCKLSVSEEVGELAGVSAVVVDLDSKLVTVHGEDLDDHAIRAAIDDAGYEAGVA
jgi:copper ion binding protein